MSYCTQTSVPDLSLSHRTASNFPHRALETLGCFTQDVRTTIDFQKPHPKQSGKAHISIRLSAVVAPGGHSTGVH
jgi:hypothetical protein